MNVSVGISDGASDAVRELLRVNGEKGFKIAGTGILEAVRDHLVARDQLPNSKGWPKTHFHDRARQQSFLRSTNFDATIHIALVGFGTYFGGKPEVIVPRNTKYLTIPAVPQAYGRRAREFSDLVFAVVINEQGRPQPALVQAAQTEFAFGRKRKDGSRKIKDATYNPGGTVYYWLAKSVHPKPHPEALPTTDKLRERAVRELESYVETL